MTPSVLSVLIGLVAGIVVAVRIPAAFPLLLLLTVPAFFRFRPRTVLLTAGFFLFGFLATSQRVPESRGFSPGACPAVIEGELASEPADHRFFLRVRVRPGSVRDADGNPCPLETGTVTVRIPRIQPLRRGDIIRLEDLRLYRRPGVTGGTAGSQNSGQSRGELRAGRAVRIGSSGRLLDSGRSGVLRYGQRVLDRHFRYAPEERLLLQVICLGREPVPFFLREIGLQSATYHLLVISGLHLSFIVLLLRILLFPFSSFRHRHPSFLPLACLTILWLYACITGLKTPVVRASLMVSFFFVGELLGREVKPLDSIFLAAIVLLVADPLNLYGVGFQLSFAATAGILLAVRILPSGSGRIPVPGASLSALLGAQAFTIPLLLFHFGLFYPLGLIANLLLVPLAGAVVICGFLFFLAPVLFAIPARLAASAFLKLTVLFSHHSRGLSFPLSAMDLLPVFAGLLALCLVRERWRFWLAAGLLAVGLVPAGIRPALRQTPRVRESVVFFSCRKPLIASAGAGYCTVFCSDDDRDRCIERFFLPFAQNGGIRKVTALFFTQAGPDPLGALTQMVPFLEVERVHLLPDAARNPLAPLFQLRFPSLISDSLAEGGQWTDGDSRIEALFPGNQREGPVYAWTRNRRKVLIAPLLGPEGALRIEWMAEPVTVLFVSDVTGLRSLNAIAETVVLPRPLKKTAFVSACGSRVMYLNEGHVFLDAAGTLRQEWSLADGG